MKNFDDFCKDQVRYGRSALIVYKKHPELKRILRIDLVMDPWWILPLKSLLQKIVISLVLRCPFFIEGCKRLIRWMEPLRSGIISYPFYRLVAACSFIRGFKRAKMLGRGVSLLMYHWFDPEKRSPFAISPVDFGKQMRYLYDKGYKTLSLDDITAYIKLYKRGQTLNNLT